MTAAFGRLGAGDARGVCAGGGASFVVVSLALEEHILNKLSALVDGGGVA